jgi:hypothetical protein
LARASFWSRDARLTVDMVYLEFLILFVKLGECDAQHWLRERLQRVSRARLVAGRGRAGEAVNL